MIPREEAELARFMTYVEVLPSGCWFYTGARSRGSGNKKWYGSFWVNTEVGTVRAHRYSDEVLNGRECPPGYHRDHICVFSLCVNPEHIEVVTREVNQERKEARRGGGGIVNGPTGAAAGAEDKSIGAADGGAG